MGGTALLRRLVSIGRSQLSRGSRTKGSGHTWDRGENKDPVAIRAVYALPAKMPDTVSSNF